jgi:adenylyltransferase/sulfurtransferase
MEVIAGRGWVFNGLTAEAYHVDYQRKETCYSHDALGEVISLPARADSITVRDVLETARHHLGPAAELELARDVLEKLVCPNCKAAEELFASLGRVPADKAWCPNCTGVRREVVTFYKIRGDEPFLDRTLAQVGVPPFDIVIAREPKSGRSIGLELSWDVVNVLGPLSGAGVPGLTSTTTSTIPGRDDPAPPATGTEGLEWT